MTAPQNDQGANNPPRSGERIAKLLARAGVASRREVERMIAEGRVKLNGAVLTTPATVLPNLKGVTVDDEPVAAAEAARLFRFHKPSGLITAERDPAGRPTIYTALRNALPPGTPRLMPVGRLDFNTEGLLLMTNDGELKRAMELPAIGHPAHLPRPHLWHDHPGPAGGTDRRRRPSKAFTTARSTPIWSARPGATSGSS